MNTKQEDELKHLKEQPILAGLEENLLKPVLAAARRRMYEAGAFIFQQGDPAEALHIVASGRVKLGQVTVEGQQIILRYAIPGEAIGLIAVVSGATYPVSAEPTEPTQTLTWSSETMRQLMAQHPPLAMNVMNYLATRVSEYQDRIRELSTERVERRIARALVRLASQIGKKTPEGILIDLALSRQDLAQMTGTTLFTVSRTLSAWEARGLIKSGREQITVLRPHGLIVIAEDLPEDEQP